MPKKTGTSFCPPESIISCPKCFDHGILLLLKVTFADSFHHVWETKSPKPTKPVKTDNGLNSTVNDVDSESGVEPCADCERDLEGDDRALQCDFCDNWFCNENCLKFSKYDSIRKSKNSDGIRCFCKHCRISFPATKKFVARLADLEEKQSKLEKALKYLKSKSVTEYSQRQNPQNAGNLENLVNQVIEEQKEREARKLNVVCFGLPESKEESHREIP